MWNVKDSRMIVIPLGWGNTKGFITEGSEKSLISGLYTNSIHILLIYIRKISYYIRSLHRRVIRTERVI